MPFLKKARTLAGAWRNRAYRRAADRSSPAPLPELSGDEGAIQGYYERLQARARSLNLSPDVIQQADAWRDGTWKMHAHLLRQIPVSWRDKTIVDYGCKYGLLFPLLFELGIKRAIGIEGSDLFVGFCRALFDDAGEKAVFEKSEAGYVPLQPETVDLVIMNEVISHIQPAFLPAAYEEVYRILVPGGMLFVSDGNNLAYPPYVQNTLLPLYEALENGPDGVKAGEVIVQSCFLNQRRAAIVQRHPGLPADQTLFLAKNTSGLWGEYFMAVIDRYVESGELIRRPFRHGVPPAYPESGVVEERGFYPEQVVYDLTALGFRCDIQDRPVRPPSEHRIVLKRRTIRPAAGYGKHAFQLPIPGRFPGRIGALLLEDGRPLPLAGVAADEIADKGLGRYSLWEPNGSIYLSSSDNSDPRTNRRRYEIFWTIRAEEPALYTGPNFRIVAVKGV
jgi:SAM-dependent methyltransferase